MRPKLSDLDQINTKEALISWLAEHLGMKTSNSAATLMLLWSKYQLKCSIRAIARKKLASLNKEA